MNRLFFVHKPDLSSITTDAR